MRKSEIRHDGRLMSQSEAMSRRGRLATRQSKDQSKRPAGRVNNNESCRNLRFPLSAGSESSQTDDSMSRDRWPVARHPATEPDPFFVRNVLIRLLKLSKGCYSKPMLSFLSSRRFGTRMGDNIESGWMVRVDERKMKEEKLKAAGCLLSTANSTRNCAILAQGLAMLNDDT